MAVLQAGGMGAFGRHVVVLTADSGEQQGHWRLPPCEAELLAQGIVLIPGRSYRVYSEPLPCWIQRRTRWVVRAEGGRIFSLRDLASWPLWLVGLVWALARGLWR